MKRLTRCGAQYFCTSKNFNDIIDKIEANDPLLTRVSFLAMTFLQLKTLNESIINNTQVVSISIPSLKDPAMYGDYRARITSEMNENILAIVAYNNYRKKVISIVEDTTPETSNYVTVPGRLTEAFNKATRYTTTHTS